MGTSPEGTAETRCDSSAVPSGLMGLRRRVPNVETLGYYRMSLRDDGSGVTPEYGRFYLGHNRTVGPKPADEANRCILRHVTPKTLQIALYVGYSQVGRPLPVVCFGWSQFPFPEARLAGQAGQPTADPAQGTRRETLADTFPARRTPARLHPARPVGLLHSHPVEQRRTVSGSRIQIHILRWRGKDVLRDVREAQASAQSNGPLE